MSRNDDAHFSQIPQININRSIFKLIYDHKTTFNAGELIPFLVNQDVLPGDTFKITSSLVIRMSTPIYPTMDNCYLDTYFFYIPNRLIWKHWKELNGENRHGAWKQTTEYEVPIFKTTNKGIETGSIADHMGLPIKIKNIEFSQLPIRAYILTWNEWFRDQNVVAPIEERTGDEDQEYGDEAINGGKPLPVYKYHDYFTSALPEPQKGEPVSLPLGTKAPVVGNGNVLGFTHQNNINEAFSISSKKIGMGGWTLNYGEANKPLGTNTYRQIENEKALGITTNPEYSGIYADLTKATAATINALRLANITQEIYEKDARGGTRYTEIIQNHFGVTSSDGRQQRPEYLGGKRIPININTVLKTSSTDEESPQGNTGAYSLSADVDEIITKSFTEHGILLGLCCVRQDHSYQQGIHKSWSRRRRFDYYLPALANLGEQPILMKEIFATGNKEQDNEVFGYQERWAEYKYGANTIAGEFRSTYQTPLDSWHYGDHYKTRPILSDEFLRETPKYIDRTLAVQSSIQNQFIFNSATIIEAVRPMPIYSIPQLTSKF